MAKDEQSKSVQHRTGRERTTPEKAVDRLQDRHERKAEPDPRPDQR